MAQGPLQGILPWQADFIATHKLPLEYVLQIETVFADRVGQEAMHRIGAGGPILLGIYGAQGSGKSTLAAYLAKRHESLSSGCCVVLSIDDFYLTRAQRQQLALEVHPLLRTRGVPGTHDIVLLKTTLDRLAHFTGPVSIPRFDKLADDRVPETQFDIVTSAPSLVILEGWCVGILPQGSADLTEPCNHLERIEDPAGDWRQFVNTSLERDYLSIWDQLDELWALLAPGFEVVSEWRLEQEVRLGAQRAEAMMTPQEVARFIQHYERLTRSSLNSMPNLADLCLRLDSQRAITEVTERKRRFYEC
jgi:D-glycerate 3-kinase